MKSRSFLFKKITPVRLFTAFFALCLLTFTVFSIAAAVKKEHPEKCAYAYAAAVESGDEEAYAALYDEEYVQFQIDYSYYKKSAFEAVLKNELGKMTSFYTEKCGENYSLDCKVTEINYADVKRLSEIQAYYIGEMKYKNEIETAAKLRVILKVNGKDGTYQTIMPDFFCLKIGGAWFCAGGFPQSLYW